MKYKIKFKALDSLDNFIEQTTKFFKKLYPHPSVKMDTLIGDKWLKFTLTFGGDKKIYILGTENKHLTFLTQHSDSNQEFSELSREELKYFDDAGYDLDSLHTERTGQLIDDWF